MKSLRQQLEMAASKTAELAETKATLWKLKAVGKFSETISTLVTAIAVVLCIAAALAVLSIGAAIWIGDKLNNRSNGFFLIGGFYVIAGTLIFLFRKKWIKRPLSNILLDKLNN